MEQILEIINTYGLETVVIALAINICTGLIKMPIKALARKLKDYTKVTRLIVFIPIILGFLFSFCYAKYIQNSYIFDRAFITLWLTSSSLSLTFYAIFEKLFPSKKKLLTESEIKTSETILENIKQLIGGILSKEDEIKTDLKEINNNENTEKIQKNKIILRGNKSA